jgi:hypothetical protein
MKHHEFTLCFGIRAEDEVDAWAQLSDLLTSISRDQLVSAMHLEKLGDLTARDAGRALRALDNLVDAFDAFTDDSMIPGRLYAEMERALDLLREYGMRPAAQKGDDYD